VGANEEHDEGKVQEVVEDEVAADTCSRVHIVDITREEVANVSSLQDKENGPKCSVSAAVPVPNIDIIHKPEDIRNDRVHCECRDIQVVHIPYSAADCEAILRLVGDVVDGADNGQEPGQDGENLVTRDRTRAMRFAPSEGVHWRHEALAEACVAAEDEGGRDSLSLRVTMMMIESWRCPRMPSKSRKIATKNLRRTGQRGFGKGMERWKSPSLVQNSRGEYYLSGTEKFAGKEVSRCTTSLTLNPCKKLGMNGERTCLSA
jgi:hypothetical protein